MTIFSDTAGHTALMVDPRIDYFPPTWNPRFVYAANLDPTHDWCTFGVIHKGRDGVSQTGQGNILFVDGHVAPFTHGKPSEVEAYP